MPTVAELLAEERAQDELIIQGALGKVINQSLSAIVHEPLPNEMALLLLQLALAESIDPGNGHITAAEDTPETEFERVTRNVANARLIVARQRERIALLQAARRPTEASLELLDTFAKTLSALEYRYCLLCDEAEGKIGSLEWLFSRLTARMAA